MKKLFIFLMSIACTVHVFGSYIHTITNKTKSHIRTKVDVKNQPDENFTLKPGETRKVDVSQACTRSIAAEGLDGEASGTQTRQELEGSGCTAVEAFIDYNGAEPGKEKRLSITLHSVKS